MLSLFAKAGLETDDTDWSLMVEDRYPDKEVKVGCMLLPEAWVQGFATENCTCLLRSGFENAPLEEITATTDPDNAESRRVLKNCVLADQGLRSVYATPCSDFGMAREEWFSVATKNIAV